MIKTFQRTVIWSCCWHCRRSVIGARSGNETRKKLIEELEEATTLTNDLNNSLNHFKSALIETKETAESVIPAFQEAIKKISKILNSKPNHVSHKSMNK